MTARKIPQYFFDELDIDDAFLRFLVKQNPLPAGSPGLLQDNGIYFFTLMQNQCLKSRLYLTLFQFFNQGGALDAQVFGCLVFYSVSHGQRLVDQASFNGIEKFLEIDALLFENIQIWPDKFPAWLFNGAVWSLALAARAKCLCRQPD